MSPLPALRSQKKWSKGGTSRTIPPEKTLPKALEVCRRIGVTRLADITNMDRLGVPNYSAVLPGTEDYIWVYSGKGATRRNAKASALMESIERYCSLPSGNRKKRFIRGTAAELSKSYTVIHPDDIIEPLNFSYSEDMIMDYLEGTDLLTKKDVLVPVPLVLFRYSPSAPALNPFAFHHTNGLASGNVLEEAVCHALCEVIERDATSIAEIRARAIPFHFLKTIENNLKRGGFTFDPIPQQKFVDDFTIFRDIELSFEFSRLFRRLASKFYQADLPLLIKDITSDIGVPTFVASSIEWISPNYGYLAEGHGTHPDARIALTRAITELSQTRAANIHGARDDLRKISFGENNTDDRRAWQFLASKERIRFDEIRSFKNEDILDDINLIIENLKRVGIRMAAIVDLTNPDIGIPVVRAIVPGLETFKITKSVIGWRARKYFKEQTGEVRRHKNL
ncbi:MAG: YcaO-like family protein [Thermoproteota archaeon]|jgi:ribosomal protein S12 methylthiotransferase accessory factor YcaO|nr:YcaO-like family protein [Thermoproteota archaeon]